MITDDLIVKKQVDFHGGKADIHFNISANGISAEDARAAEFGFDRFVSVCSGRPVGRRPVAGNAVNFLVSRWTPEELESISKSTDVPGAIQSYREKFPESTRPDSAISRMLRNIKDQKKRVPKVSARPPSPKGEDPAENKTRNDKVPTTKRDQFGIPRDLYANDLKKYHRLTYICKTRKVSYEEALKIDEKKHPAKPAAAAITGSDGLSDVLPEKNPTRKERGVETPQHKMDRTHPADRAKAKVKAAADKVQQQEKKVILTSGVLSKPPEPSATPQAPKFTHGMKVRYIGTRSLFSGQGTVKRMNLQTGDVLVDINNGLEWIPCKDLTDAPAPVPATGAV